MIIHIASPEEAEAYANLIKTLNITQEELAGKIGKSRVYVTNILGLLRLPEGVKNDILHGLISMGHAKVLSKLEDKELVTSLSERIKNEHLSVRELEAITSTDEYKRTNSIVKIKINSI